MPARSLQSTKTATVAPAVAQAQPASSEARLAAVVEAAYILEARTR
jgi:hypothetical protein